jgi:hypothetical protein
MVAQSKTQPTKPLPPPKKDGFQIFKSFAAQIFKSSLPQEIPNQQI